MTLLQDTLYRAEGTVLLSDPRSSGGVGDEIDLILDPARYVPNQVKIIESPQVAQRAAENLNNGTTTRDVQQATSAIQASDLGAITVFGTMPTATEASELVDAVVSAYQEISTEQIQSAANARIATLEAAKIETEERISDLDGLIAQDPDNSALQARRTAAIEQFVALDTRIELLTTNAALYGSGVQLYVAPDLPTKPLQPRPLRNAALAFVIGLAAAVTWAWWRSEHNQIVDSHDIAARTIDAPLLASVPEFGSVNVEGPVPTITAPESVATEAYHFALSSLGFSLEKVDGKAVLITSSTSGDGKTATAINLAIVAAHDGRKPLLIDADERARGLTRIAGLDGKLGISDLNGPGSAQRSTHRWILDDQTEIDVVPAGTGVEGNTASFFRSEAFRAALPRLLDRHDLVIIDSPPVMAAAETTDIAGAADAIVLVVAEGSPLTDLEGAKQRLEMSGTPIVGYIFNKSKARSNVSGYRYGYGTKD